MSILLAAYLVQPTSTNPLHSLIFLSYPLPPHSPLVPSWVQDGPDIPQYYGKGSRDFAFVGFYIIVLTFTREFLMQRVLRPAAIHFGMRTRTKQNRFMEQAYTAIYFAIFGPYGIFVMYRTPVWYFNTVGMYEGYPHRAHDSMFKAYYLLQASYWAQQAIVLVLQLEKPRKDFKELVGHHIITLALIWLSYRFHFTYVGVAVYITHDISDFFLAVIGPTSPGLSIRNANCQSQTSKTLNYVSSPIVVPYFSFFIAIWVYLRHYINLTILYSVLNTYRTVGPFDLNWETQQYKCWISQYISFALLASLQALNLFWLFFIVKIAVNIVFSDESKDVRSDDEEEEEPAFTNNSPQEANGSAVNHVSGNGFPTSKLEPDKEMIGGGATRFEEKKIR